MMRIGSGSFGGRKLHAPKGTETRPTSGRLKKSLFDVLAASVEAARVLDLYAGAGALGLEALSRGAVRVVFVERGRKAVAAIERNVEELGVEDRTELRRAGVRPALVKLAEARDFLEPFDIVFADPPYGSPELTGVLQFLGEGNLVAEGGRVIVEHHHKAELSKRYGNLERFRCLTAGESCFTLYRRLC